MKRKRRSRAFRRGLVHDITLNGDRYKIGLRWHTEDETTYEDITVPKALCEKLFFDETRDDAYAELKRIHDEEMKIREAERKAEYEKRQAELAEFEKKKRYDEYLKLKKEFED